MPKTCPYHGKSEPCDDCRDNYRDNRPDPMGAFAHAPSRGIPAPAYVPPQKRPIHIRQSKRDTCGVACCGMVGANLGCTREFSMAELLAYMKEMGVYCTNEMSFFHALGIPLRWLGLNCELLENKGIADFPEILRASHFIIMEANFHVLVIYDVNADGSFVVGDPGISKPEMNVPAGDYRLRGGTGRIWVVGRKGQ